MNRVESDSEKLKKAALTEIKNLHRMFGINAKGYTENEVAKESADIILLEKDLMVLEEGIIEGRKTYANMIKYIKMTASSNFGNMIRTASVPANDECASDLPKPDLRSVLYGYPMG